MHTKPVMYINKLGGTEWRVNGARHRTDGPAYISKNGDKSWWLNGKLHRQDGPAIIIDSGGDYQYSLGERHAGVPGNYWYLYAKRYSFEVYVKVAGWSDEQVVMYKLANI